MLEIRALPSLGSLIMSYISGLILIAIIALGIYMAMKVLSVTKDIKDMKRDMKRIVELLDNKD